MKFTTVKANVTVARIAEMTDGHVDESIFVMQKFTPNDGHMMTSAAVRCGVIWNQPTAGSSIAWLRNRNGHRLSELPTFVVQLTAPRPFSLCIGQSVTVHSRPSSDDVHEIVFDKGFVLHCCCSMYVSTKRQDDDDGDGDDPFDITVEGWNVPPSVETNALQDKLLVTQLRHWDNALISKNGICTTLLEHPHQATVNEVFG